MACDLGGQLRGGMRYGVCVVAALMLLSLRPNLEAFVAAPRASGQQMLVAAPVQGDGVSQNAQRMGGSAVEAEGSSSLCGIFGAAVAAGACLRGLQVIMRSSKQGGIAVMGQHFMPSMKGAKKKHIMRKRKNYGTWKALRQPRRYELYDILEELDETTPWYTIVSEPEEPMMPVEGVPLKERYPWAGELMRLHPRKEELEAPNSEDRLAPNFQPLWKAPPPTGRVQRYIHRKGFPEAKNPPWLNSPEIGYEVRIPNDMPFKKFREPTLDMMGPKLRAKVMAERMELKAKGLPSGLDEDDDLDDALDALE